MGKSTIIATCDRSNAGWLIFAMFLLLWEEPDLLDAIIALIFAFAGTLV